MSLSRLARDRYFSVAIGLSFLILIIASAIFYVRVEPTDKPLILHFDSYRGIDFLGSRAQVFGIILSVFVLLLINFFLARLLYDRERLLSYIFVFASLLLSILILMAVSVIISANN
jgi:hypothetical protein